jgi:NAD+ kinase
MMHRVSKALIIANLSKLDAEQTARDVERYLSDRGITCTTFTFRGKPTGVPPIDCDIAFSLGGDGTVLYTARMLARHEIPIMAVNIGDFGFITETGRDEWPRAFERYLEGELGISRRIMLDTRVVRDGIEIAAFDGLNDSVIASSGISKIVRLAVDVDGTSLGRYRADGVIVSTPTGSTAHSAAAGGPILDPEMHALVMIPICPFTLSNRPIVLRGNEPIYLTVEPEQRTELYLTVDGQDLCPLCEGDRICFRVSDSSALIVRSDKRNFFEVLRSKLNWSGGPDA